MCVRACVMIVMGLCVIVCVPSPTAPGAVYDEKAGRLAARGKGAAPATAVPLTAAAKAVLKMTEGGDGPPSPPVPAPPPALIQPMPDGYKFFTLDSLTSGDPGAVLTTFEDVTGLAVYAPVNHRAPLAEFNEALQRAVDAPCPHTAAQVQQQKAFNDVHAAFTHRCMASVGSVVSDFLSGADAVEPREVTIDGVRFRCSLEFKGNPGNTEYLVQELLLSIVPGLHVPLCAVFDVMGVRVVATCPVGSRASVLPQYVDKGPVVPAADPRSPSTSPEPADITGDSAITVDPDSHPVFVSRPARLSETTSGPVADAKLSPAPAPPSITGPAPEVAPSATLPSDASAPVLVEGPAPESVPAPESAHAPADAPAPEGAPAPAAFPLGKAVEALLKKSMDTYPQPDQPPATLQADADTFFKALSQQLFQSPAMTLQPWLSTGNASVYQGDDGRLYLDAVSMEGCVPPLPAAFLDTLPAMYVPGEGGGPVCVTVLPGEPLLELISRCRGEEQCGEGYDDVTEFVPEGLRAAVEAAFVNKGCPDDGELRVWVWDHDPEDVRVLFTRPGDPDGTNSRLDMVLTARRDVDADVSFDLSSGVAEALFVHVNTTYVECRRFCRPELLPVLCKMKDLGSPVDTDEVTALPPQFITSVLGKTVRGLVSKLEGTLGPVPGPGVRPPPLQHVTLSLKQSFHGAGLNLRFLGVARCVLVFLFAIVWSTHFVTASLWCSSVSGSVSVFDCSSFVHDVRWFSCLCVQAARGAPVAEVCDAVRRGDACHPYGTAGVAAV